MIDEYGLEVDVLRWQLERGYVREQTYDEYRSPDSCELSIDQADYLQQALKLCEEAGEVAKAVLLTVKDNNDYSKNAEALDRELVDVAVVLYGLAAMRGVNLQKEVRRLITTKADK